MKPLFPTENSVEIGLKVSCLLVCDELVNGHTGSVTDRPTQRCKPSGIERGQHGQNEHASTRAGCGLKKKGQANTPPATVVWSANGTHHHG